MKHRRSIDLTARASVIPLPRREDAGLTRDHYFFVEVWTDNPDAGGRMLETINYAYRI